MTAEELIEYLKTFPPETSVMVEGYETGYDDIIALNNMNLVRYRNAQEWDGEFHEVDKRPNNTGGGKRSIILIGRRGHLR